jgi:cytoskeletal protein RodZ
LEKIGQFLKQQREELGFTIDEMSQKTKISTNQLREIEEGNLDFFHDDITFLPFMIKRYAKALYVDDKIKDEVDGLVGQYQHTMKIKKIQEKDSIEKNVASRVKKAVKTNQKLSPSHHTRQPEFSQLSLIFIILVIIASLIFMVVTVVLPLINQSNNNPIDEDPIVNLPENPNEKPEDEDPVVDENPGESEDTSTVEVVQKDSITYQVIDFKDQEEVSISLAFNTDTWVQVYLDGKKTDNPRSKIYKPGETIDVITFAEEGHTVMFHLGIVRSNEFFMNDEAITLDKSTADSTAGTKITFVFTGE